MKILVAFMGICLLTPSLKAESIQKFPLQLVADQEQNLPEQNNLIEQVDSRDHRHKKDDKHKKKKKKKKKHHDHKHDKKHHHHKK